MYHAFEKFPKSNPVLYMFAENIPFLEGRTWTADRAEVLRLVDCSVDVVEWKLHMPILSLIPVIVALLPSYLLVHWPLPLIIVILSNVQHCTESALPLNEQVNSDYSYINAITTAYDSVLGMTLPPSSGSMTNFTFACFIAWGDNEWSHSQKQVKG